MKTDRLDSMKNKKIKLSEFLHQPHSPADSESINIVFIVDTNFTKQGGGKYIFKNCEFLFTEKGLIRFDNCIIENCVFIGINDLELYSKEKNKENGNILINQCEHFKNNRFKGVFRNLSFSHTNIVNLIDDSICIKTTFSSLKITNAKINGQCNQLIFNYSKFITSKGNVSIWNKIILDGAKCDKAIFDNVRVNPFYLATKCDNKASLDLSRATLIDDWSRLRKKYAGISLFIVFILTFLFFLPLLTQSFFLLLTSKINSTIVEFNSTPLWKALLFGGKENLSAFLYFCLTIVLILYNSGRLWMTISIAKLREEENFLKDSNFQLVSIHPEKLKTQLIVDKLLNFMFWISFVYSIFKLIDTLSIQVPIFS
ncbi:MAG: hypothetical protein JKX79_01695 [Labilibaculum sp.]|nr:hypothetical protein [Labilibaculum sp.]